MITVCAAGMRASMAGGILQRDGRENVKVLSDAGTGEWIAQGYPTGTGEESLAPNTSGIPAIRHKQNRVSSGIIMC